MPENVNEKNSLSPYTGPWGKPQILHLLRRTLFGVSISDYKRFASLSLEQCLEILLFPSPTPPPPVNAYNTEKKTDPDVGSGKTWVNAPWNDDFNLERLESNKAWWVGQMLNQHHSVTEKMTLFYSNNFAVQSRIVKEPAYDYRYVALLREHSLGNYKKLVRRITTDLDMLFYLNGDLNTAGAPNENYARELQELFTVGKGPNSHYTENDVKSAAKVLTGWTDALGYYPGHFLPSTVFDPVGTEHDTSDKQFSSFYNNAVIKGNRGEKETDQLIDIIFQQRENALNFCRKIYRWFVYYSIDDQVEANIISPLADTLMAHDFEVGPVLKKLFSSEHFFDNAVVGCLIKNPVDHLIGAWHQFQVVIPVSASVAEQYNVWLSLKEWLKKLGMEPLEPLDVAGWPAYHQSPGYHQLWINSTTLPLRNYVTDICSSGSYQAGSLKLQFDVLRFTSLLPDPDNIGKLITDSTAFLCAVPFDENQIRFFKSILLSGEQQDHYWTSAWQNYIADTSNEVNRSVVESRLQKYYTYLLQRPEYQLG